MNSYSKDTTTNLPRSPIKIKVKKNVVNKGNNKHLINGRVHATECAAGFSSNIAVMRLQRHSITRARKMCYRKTRERNARGGNKAGYTATC